MLVKIYKTLKYIFKKNERLISNMYVNITYQIQKLKNKLFHSTKCCFYLLTFNVTGPRDPRG